MMIHHPWTMLAGDANDFRKMADDLDKISESMQETYLSKATDMKSEDLVALLDAETWLTAQECLDLGLCDVVGDEQSIAASVRDFEILAKYKNTPRFIKVKDAAEPPAASTDPPGVLTPKPSDEELAKAKAKLALECLL